MKQNPSSERILIIEDDALIREAVFLKFTQEGYVVDCVLNGEEGLEKLRMESYTGILLDLRMPKADGFFFLKEKQLVSEFRDIPVVVFSNLSQIEFIDRAISLGAKGYLIKTNHSVQEIVEEATKCFAKGECKIDR